ncbi:hypothetical protein EJ05DRAFT_502944 [Pseudovirgaria hyperparasitica]|uniref:Uncharacterized protein n=1 Tax=Pseudovirgaria hyperparasitica TaxID=470096 RepID=A0A6A6VZ21_9PEZI|nr:uncharacterized protein EJ05DRAFT_502944 [Pseudovirgaria hyperparasitica]KAF2755485.1 hypothetical protein EJ05DRAFT_502944 [Pseudovirgaria hyperparasitica]
MQLFRKTHNAEATASANRQNLVLPDNLPCYMIPYGRNLKFYGREAELDEIKTVLDPTPQSDDLKVLSICGLGGVGKTQLALQYANTMMESYDAVAWIPADTQAILVRALAMFAAKLGLMKDGSEDDLQAVQKVRDWLSTAGRRVLLVFDNLEDVQILSQVWPWAGNGSFIITTRSPAVASGRARCVLHLKSFETSTAVKVLNELTGIQALEESEKQAAIEICQSIGGLPLAIVHMSSFIQDRGSTYEEFLDLFKKHAERILASSQTQVDYDHTLYTVWDSSMQSLSTNAKTLLSLLSFFDPNAIPERFLTNPQNQITDPRFEFLSDDFAFGDAVSELITKASLVDRLTSAKSISMNRLVKIVSSVRVPEEERTVYFNTTIQMLSNAFPNTWDSRVDQQGHGFQSWETCSAVVAHVSSLMVLQEQYGLEATNTEAFAELVFRIGTYLWESEQPLTAKTFFEYGLHLGIDPESRVYAHVYRLLGHIALDIAQPRAALAAYQRAYEVTELLDGPESIAVGEVLDSLACSCAEIGDVLRARAYLERSDEINQAQNGRTSSRTQAIFALAYLRGHEPEEALDALNLCWRLQGKTGKEIKYSQYPKHAGDIVLYARIKFALGQKDEARQLVLRSIEMRRGIFSSKGPRVADSLFILARMLEDEAEENAAAKMYREIIDMNCGSAEMKGHLARSLWFLAGVEGRLGRADYASDLRKLANEERAKIMGREHLDEDTDEAFMSLVGWMLW